MSSTPDTPIPDAASGGDQSVGGRAIAAPWPRIAARLLDYVVAGFLLGALVTALLFDDVESLGPNGDATTAERLTAAIAVMAIWFVWEAVATAVWGGTPMKLLLGLRVVDAEGQPVGWRAAVVRWGLIAVWNLLAFIGLVVQLALLGVSLVFMFTRPDRRAVWDRVAKTMVVSTR